MKRHRTLEEIDGDHWKDEGRSPYSSGQWGVEQAARAALARKPSLPQQPVIGISGCWCGKPGNHDWEGKERGEPHPH